MLTLFLALCLSGTPYAACNLYTADDVIPVAIEVDRSICWGWAAVFQAEPGVRQKVGSGRYLRIFCGEVVGVLQF